MCESLISVRIRLSRCTYVCLRAIVPASVNASWEFVNLNNLKMA